MVFWPPRTIKRPERFENTPTENIQVSEPAGYFEMTWLLSNFSAIIPDSGGLQKEAFFFKIMYIRFLKKPNR